MPVASATERRNWGFKPAGMALNQRDVSFVHPRCLAISRQYGIRVIDCTSICSKRLCIQHLTPPAPCTPTTFCRNPASGKVGFYLGKEAVPRHRLQALLTKGDFDGALDLARAHSMDETDVHAARLLALLREGGSAAVGGA